MSEIGDELREWAAAQCNAITLYKLADRIDAEMAELPRGKDGKPIHVGETVYGEDGKAWHVYGIVLCDMSETERKFSIKAIGDGGSKYGLRPEWLTHERPDSWGRIAQELEDMSENFRATDQESFSALLDFADRIRRLAEREASNGTD